MIHVQTQRLYERHTGDAHEVTVLFGGINPASPGNYRVVVDGEFHSIHRSKLQAFDEIVEIIKVRDWTSINRV